MTTETKIKSCEKTVKLGTLYFESEMMGNVCKIEARDISTWLAPYAQYDRAVFCQFTPKGKRTARQMMQSYKPNLVILEGHGHPEPASMFGDTETHTLKSGEEVGYSQSRHSSFDGAWARDFAEMLAKYLDSHPAVKIVADYRGADSQDKFKRAND